MSAQRICSLLPSATEIVYALGLEERLVGVTHECDYPPAALLKPKVTSSIIDAEGMSSSQIDQAVRESLADQATIYSLDEQLLAELQPDLILTQELCDVCAVGSGLVRETVSALPGSPQIVSLEPRTLGEVLDSILLVGRLAGEVRRAITLVDSLRQRIEAVRRAVSARPTRQVLTLEWTDPVFVGGHWVPEMVEIAGGHDVLGAPGNPSREVSWEEIAATAADVVVAMPCGFGLERSGQELERTDFPPQWGTLPAVSEGSVFVVDGSSYFNRPGPRLVDGVEILATILHPDVFSKAPVGSFRQRESPAGIPG
jgi:iron complex transport system substrate-binding protein